VGALYIRYYNNINFYSLLQYLGINLSKCWEPNAISKTIDAVLAALNYPKAPTISIFTPQTRGFSVRCSSDCATEPYEISVSSYVNGGAVGTRTRDLQCDRPGVNSNQNFSQIILAYDYPISGCLQVCKSTFFMRRIDDQSSIKSRA